MLNAKNSFGACNRWGGFGDLPAPSSGELMNWLEEVAGRVPLALVWLAAVAIGLLIYAFPIARILDSLLE